MSTKILLEHIAFLMSKHKIARYSWEPKYKNKKLIGVDVIINGQQDHIPIPNMRFGATPTKEFSKLLQDKLNNAKS